MVTKTILDNGIRVISETMPHAHSVSVGIWVDNGSRHEEERYSGVAHFLEHLLFKGTARRSALDIAREIDSVGGVLNAFTGREYVCYYAKILNRFLPKAVDLLTDIFLNSVFDDEEIEKERKVILQEVSMLEDAPDDFIHDLFSQEIWKNNPLGRPVIGTEQSIGGLTRDAIIGHKDRNYRTEDIIVTAAGKITHQELLDLVKEKLSPASRGKNDVIVTPPDYAQSVIVNEKDLEQVHVCLGTKALPQNHSQRFEAFILNTVLGGSMSSRLFQEVREKNGLAYSVYSYISSHSDSGALAIYAGTSTDRLQEVIEIVLRELKRLKQEPLSVDELDAAKEQIKGNLLMSLESSDNRMSKLAKNEVYFGGYQSLRAIMAGLDRVTPNSLLSLCDELFQDRYLSMALLGNVDGATFSPEGLVL